MKELTAEEKIELGGVISELEKWCKLHDPLKFNPRVEHEIIFYAQRHYDITGEFYRR